MLGALSRRLAILRASVHSAAGFLRDFEGYLLHGHGRAVRCARRSHPQRPCPAGRPRRAAVSDKHLAIGGVATSACLHVLSRTSAHASQLVTSRVQVPQSLAEVQDYSSCKRRYLASAAVR